MDPLSVSSGVAGLIALAGTVGSTVWKIQASFRGARETCAKLTDELSAIGSTLTNLQYRVDALRESNSLGTLEQLEVPLKQCRITLQELLKELQNTEMTFRKRIAWVFKDEERVLGFVERLAQHKSHFTLVLQMDASLDLDEIKTSVVSIKAENSTFHDTVKSSISGIQAEQERVRQEQERKQQEKKLRNIIEWLAPLDFESKLDSSLSQRQPETCLWLIEGDRIKSWRSEPGSSLWLHGIPGNGKTILASALVDHVTSTKSEGECLAYAYFDFRETKSRNPINVFRSILAQLLMDFRGDLTADFDHLVKQQSNKKGPPNSLPKLADLIQKAAKLWKHPLIIIDALDESDDRESLLRAIQQLNDAQCVSMFLSSRKEADITEALDEFPQISLKEEQGSVQSDINRHIQEEISNRPRLRNLPPGVKANLYSVLSGKADGMFRWVQCQLDFIATRKTFKGIQAALDDLPAGLFPTYERILNNIEEAGEETSVIAKRSLRWILGAYRPLRLVQIAEAIMVEPGNSSLNEDLALLSPDTILEVCSSLLLHDTTTDIVTLSHFSVQEYLFSKHLEKSDLVHFYYISLHQLRIDLTIRLLTYLTLDEFCRETCTDGQELLALIDEHPLLPHAAEFWYQYIATIESVEEDLVPPLLQFFNDPFKSLCHRLWEQVLYRDQDFAEHTWPKTFRHYRNPTWFIFQQGRPRWVIKRLLQECPDLMSCDFGADIGTVLMIALRHFQRDLVGLYLEMGADIQQTFTHDGKTRDTICEGISHGNIDSVRVLIERGADVNKELPGGWRAIHQAAATGMEDYVHTIVEAGCDVNAVTESGKTALTIAFEMQRPAVARYLISHGASFEHLENLAPAQVEWATAEPWYGELQKTIQEQFYADFGDVAMVSKYLSEYIGLSRPLVKRILDYAEYWARYSKRRDELQSYDQRRSDNSSGYLSIPVRGEAVRRVVFTTVSHDQGFSGSPREQGTYWNAWTWFEAGYTGSRSRKHIQTNIHAQWESHLHTVVWDYRDPAYKEWLEGLSGVNNGGELTVYAMARFPAWVNYVESVQIVVYSSYV